MLEINEEGIISFTKGEYAEIEVELEHLLDGTPYVMGGGDFLEFSVVKELCDKKYAIYKKIVDSNIVKILPSDTANMPCGSYLYDIRLTCSDGLPHTIIDPTLFELKCGVTK